MAIEGKGRWVTIAGRHIFVEEGETPMITYYKKRAREENNQYYSDNAERLAEEYIKYREELKKKGRN